MNAYKMREIRMWVVQVIIPTTIATGYVLFCTSRNGWGWANFLEEVNTGKGRRLSTALKFYMSVILPAVIVVIYLKGYYDTFASKGTPTLIFWMLFAVLLLAAVFGIVFYKKKK